MEKIVKVILAFLLILCLLEFPYGYFQFVRFVAMAGFAFLALKSRQQQNSNEVIVYIALARSFQPFFRIAFGQNDLE